jgi:NADPH:quinone reductase-like Zn-dependent oxidoreductase
MKAAAYTRYGPLDVVQIMEVEKPFPKDNEVLIKVHAASVNPVDWRLMEGRRTSHPTIPDEWSASRK